MFASLHALIVCFLFFSFFVSSQSLATTNIASSHTALKVEKKTDRSLQGRSLRSLAIKVERMKTRKVRPTLKVQLRRRGSWDWTGALGARASRLQTLGSARRTPKRQSTWSTKGSTGPLQLRRQPITKPLPSTPKSRTSRRNLKEHWNRARPTSSASSRPISSSSKSTTIKCTKPTIITRRPRTSTRRQLRLPTPIPATASSPSGCQLLLLPGQLPLLRLSQKTPYSTCPLGAMTATNRAFRRHRNTKTKTETSRMKWS